MMPGDDETISTDTRAFIWTKRKGAICRRRPTRLRVCGGHGPRNTLIDMRRAFLLLLVGLSALACSSCATLPPDQQADNSETRFQQEMQLRGR
jgi:hypothetical protein